MKAPVLLVDDHVVVRTGLREMIAGTPDLQVAGEAADGAAALRLARAVPASAMVLDLALPEMGGMQVLEAMRAGGLALPVLFYSMYPATQYARHARAAGAQGYVSKDADAAALLRALRKVVRGVLAFEAPPRRSGALHAAAVNPFAALSRREAEVARGLVSGEPLTRIAERLGVDARSVTTYRRRVLDKLGARSNAELTALALRFGRL